MTRSAAVVVASTRAAAGIYPDLTGPLLVEWLRGKGFDCADPVVVRDGPAVLQALRDAVARRHEVVVTTGGTGLSPTDRTPEATRQLLDIEIPGIAEALRRAGAENVPAAVLSRGIAGVAGRTVIVNLPGSTGGIRDGIAVLDPILDHLVDQAHGGDH